MERLFVFALTMEEIFVSTDFKETGYGVNIFKRKNNIGGKRKTRKTGMHSNSWICECIFSSAAETGI